MWKIFYISLICLITDVTPKLFDCPIDWVEFNSYCYRFIAYPRKNYDEANIICRDDGATLVSVNNDAEHRFINDYLVLTDQRRDMWFTSGSIRRSVAGGVQWEGDKTFSQTLDLWLNASDATQDGSTIVYKYSGAKYGWGIAPQATILSFICEISQAEAYRIVEEDRDFDYGIDIIDPNLIPRGPQFIVEPVDTMILGTTTSVFLDCVASGTPNPEYTWFKITTQSREKLTVQSDSRYTITNGRLSISNPSSVDESDYQCTAENNQGKTLSSRIQLSFGFLKEFNNNPQSSVTATELDGAQMKCPDIGYKPDIFYQWYKDTVLTFVRPRLQKHIFISKNGKLYFSEVTNEDAGWYHCLVTLVNNNKNVGEAGNYVGASQAPKKASLGFQLFVRNRAGGRYQPQIQDDFISVFPGNPKKGQTLSMECFAYGTGPLIYKWSRIDKAMPKGVTFIDSNRILVIPDVAPEDQGMYRCRVDSTSSGLSDVKDYSLRIESIPYFTFPLKDQHADNNARLTWYCEASANPRPTYQWYRNGELLRNQTGVMTIIMNMLRLESLKKTDNAMYQCSATNIYGTVFSTAQLRVLEFKPSFKKHPLEKMVTAARGGNITYMCNPEAAPSPTYMWLKDGRDLGLSKGSISGNLRMLMNGNLYIEGVRTADQGRYTCSVENEIGDAQSSGVLTVVDKTTITRAPSPVRVNINNTATMMCEGSHIPNMDMVYSWYFNGYQIDLEENPHYRMGGGITNGYLYILNAQFTHAGSYTCEVATGLDQTRASADLNVLGPPGQPAGLYEDTTKTAQKSVTLLWTDGLSHGSEILYYVLEFSTSFNPKWRVMRDRLFVSEVIPTSGLFTKKTTTLTDLKPGADYYFRIRANNRLGIGEASKPTTAIHIDSDSPKKAPDNVGGGGGKVGDLTITWTPLPEEDLNGVQLGYQVYWRTKPAKNSESKWEQARVYGADRSWFVTTVGDEVYYTDYQVKVQAFNELGLGKMSDPVDIKSAEDLPNGTPTKVYSDSFNSTSLIVFWNPVIDDRANMKGKLIGYKINYWERYEGIEQGAPQNILSGQIDQGLIIGLEPDTWYTVNVQVYNGAGNGPKSEIFHQSTDRSAPQLYPTEIYIHSYGADSVRATFRGVSTQNFEEPLQGYTIQYWRSGENIRSSLQLDCMKNNYGIITGIEPNVIYQLRVFGYSQGGQGKMSSPASYFTLGGAIRLDLSTTEILAGASSITPYFMVILLLSFISLIHNV